MSSDRDRGSGWFAAAGHIVGSARDFERCWHWNGSIHASREAAIRSGLREFASDDFNVGRLDEGRVVWFGWMDEEFTDPEDREDVATGLGLKS